jgi:hypothetical protein
MRLGGYQNQMFLWSYNKSDSLRLGGYQNQMFLWSYNKSDSLRLGGQQNPVFLWSGTNQIQCQLYRANSERNECASTHIANGRYIH